MDDRRFDALARSLAGPQPRRRFLRGLLVALGGGGLAAVGLSRDDEGARSAPCRSAGQLCAGPPDCCPGFSCQAPGPGAPKRCVVVPTARRTNTATATSTATRTQVPPTNTPTNTPTPLCRVRNEACASTSDVCCDAGYVCGDDGCGELFACCGQSGAACAQACDCCGISGCTDGVCN